MSATISLQSKLDLRAAGPLRQDLLACQGADLVLDASGVTQIGGLALQVIRSAARTWSEAGKTLRFENASTDVCDQLSLLGFNPDTLTKWEHAT